MGGLDTLDHKQVSIYYPGYDEIIEVDEGIAPLLQALWDAGIMTLNSCEENEPGVVWIEFYSAEDVEEFLTLLMVAFRDQALKDLDTGDCLFSRMLGEEGENMAAWRYIAHPNIHPDLGPESLDGRDPPISTLAMTVSVRFPRDDYPRILELLSKLRIPCH